MDREQKLLKNWTDGSNNYSNIVPPQYTDEMLEYRRSMPVCQRIRPQWDLETLIELGYKKISCKMDIGDRVYDEKQRIINRSTPMFMLVVEK